MLITLSGEKKEVKDKITVTELLKQEKTERIEYVTVSVNDNFVRKEDFDNKTLSDGDSVEFLYFMGGGSGSLQC